jgi:hypothetical protein
VQRYNLFLVMQNILRLTQRTKNFDAFVLEKLLLQRIVKK